MNVSRKNKIIWWSPECVDGRITRKIFSNYDFYVKKKDGTFVVLSENEKESNSTEIDGIYSDYTIICSIINPYQWIWNIFLDKCYKNVVIDKFSHDIVIKKFNSWIQSVFIEKKLIVKIDTSFNYKIDGNNFFQKFLFNKKTPDYFIRNEFILEDLEKIPLIKNDLQSFSGIIKKNYKITTNPLEFYNVYSIESARLVYFLYKKFFYLTDYNPFSFTDKILTEEQKISFIHDIFKIK
jgi:hypothetical protein